MHKSLESEAKKRKQIAFQYAVAKISAESSVGKEAPIPYIANTVSNICILCKLPTPPRKFGHSATSFSQAHYSHTP